MKYAEVAVDAPIGVNRTLTYEVPSRFQASPGQMVWVPLGRRPVQGVVFEVNDKRQFESPRPIISTIEPSPVVSPVGLKMARWLSSYYLSTLFEAASLMLPPGFKDRVNTYLEPATSQSGSLDGDDDAIWRDIVSRGRVLESEVKKFVGRNVRDSIALLVRRGLLRRVWEIPHPRTVPRYDLFLLPYQADEKNLWKSHSLASKAPRQAALLKALLKGSQRLLRAQARKEYGDSAVTGLIKKGLLGQEWIRREVANEDSEDNETESPLTLTSEQAVAVSYVETAIERDNLEPRTVLLHGVTGSGKTEVYLRAMQRCIALGYQGILLVPEISLTPQMVYRLNARFPGKVALVHSGLSLREQFEYWWRIRDGAYDVVVGPRSALFSPLPKLGLIVIDEEHEWTYKEQERPPRYHARDVALKLAQLSRVPVMMGSATPDVATYYQAQQGHYRLFELPYRIGPVREPSKSRKLGGGLAKVEIQDMRQELKDGNRSPFSRCLAQALKDCVSRGEQAILFLNRRGSSTIVQCRDCGLALRCRRCSVTLTYHQTSGLICHHCDRRTKSPDKCPECSSLRIRYLGLGTERVVQDLEELVPQARVIRWDSDTAHQIRAHRSLLAAFSDGQAQVLVGTQMVAKGLHIPNVSLVGVVLADIGLYFPDFRAGERTFQLLCQVAGRAGRGIAPGRVIIQTYNPENYAVRAAGHQDYSRLYKKEIEYRREQRNPPFSRLIHMLYLSSNEGACRQEAHRFASVLRSTAYGQGFTDIEVIGPSPAHPQRVRGRYRWHLILRGRDPRTFLETVTIPKGWVIDVDPVTVL